jgi:hypothetical protein
VIIKIHGNVLNPEIIPCFTQVRNAICHYSNTYQASELEKIVAYAKSNCPEPSQDLSKNSLKIGLA